MPGMAGVVVATTGIAGLAILPDDALPGAGLIGAAVVIVFGGGSVPGCCWRLPTGEPHTTKEAAVMCTSYLITPVTFDKYVDPDEVARQFTEFVGRAFREAPGMLDEVGVTFIGTSVVQPGVDDIVLGFSSGRP